MIDEAFVDAEDAYVSAAGVEITYAGATIRAVFGAGFISVQSGDVRVGSRRPEVHVARADLPDWANALLDPPEGGDELRIADEFYEVVTVKPTTEGTGFDLVLKRQRSV